jgi:hypothetical protein
VPARNLTLWAIPAFVALKLGQKSDHARSATPYNNRMAESIAAAAEQTKTAKIKSTENAPTGGPSPAEPKAKKDGAPGAPVFSRLSLPFAMVPGEAFVEKARAIQLRSAADDTAYDHIDGTLYLTNARLWFEPDQVAGDALRSALEKKGALKSKSIPIRYVVKAHVRKVKKKPVLRLQFDNGGREFFRVSKPLKWRDAILAAAPNAPDDLPFSYEPSYRHGVEYKGHLIKAALRALITLAVIAAVAMFFEPLWRPYLPRVIALIDSVVRR